jgi:hypothetical protein
MPPRMERPNFVTPQAAPQSTVVGTIHAAAAPLSSLQQQAIDHARQMEQRLPPEMQTKINPDRIRDEHTAGDYLSQVATKLQTFAEGVRSAKP